MTAAQEVGPNGRGYPARGRLATRLADPFDRVYGQPCESCGATPGRLCLTKRGGFAMVPHDARVVLRRLVRVPDEEEE